MTETGAPSVLFYVLEAYSSALSHLELGEQRRKKLVSRFLEAVLWLIEHQNKAGSWDYHGWWGNKLGGLALHMMIFERAIGVPPGFDLVPSVSPATARSGSPASPRSQGEWTGRSVVRR